MIRTVSHPWRRALCHVLVVTLAVFGLTMIAVPAASAAPPPLSVAKTGPSTVLEGGSVRYTVAASNSSSAAGGVRQYNVSFREVLPAGVSYLAGSTQPADTGEPVVITDPTTGAQTLIWSDLFDLPPGGSDSISFAVQPNNAVFAVGSTFTDSATGYGSTNPRVVPRFTGTGLPIPSLSVIPSAPSSASTTVTALEVTKAEPSPEAKLLRGVHDHPTVYTVSVRNSERAATSGVVVSDYLPASLEFLGCGGVDNSAGPEYPGAASLTATPAVGANCPTPTAVETVTNPAGYPAGVYTRVTWNVGALAADQTVTIRYAAGIPLRANTATFPGGTPPPASGLQTANLDNNTGASTRQDGAAAGLTNFVHASGTYSGPVAPGSSTSVSADMSHTVTADDLRILKSATPTSFEAGGIVTYTLRIDASEYVDGSNIVVTDTIPNGVCPLDTLRNYVTGAPADCDPGSVAPSVPFTSVTQNADGTFTVTFPPSALAHNGTATVSYQGRMRDVYTGGALAGVPTAAGDTFTNKVSLAATTTPRPGTGETGPLPVVDGSSVTQESSSGTLAKLIQPRTNPQDCSAGTYASPLTLSAAQLTFRKGDRICFDIVAPFSTFTETRNPVLTDFLPLNTSYETGSFTLGPRNTVPPAEVRFDETLAATGALTWTLGAPELDGSLAVPAGAVFDARVSVTVDDAAAGPAPDKVGNIAKLVTETSSGLPHSSRSEANFAIAAAPPVAITKGVASVNGLPSGGNGPDVDHVQVKEGDTVVFRVDVSNNGAASTANDFPVRAVQTWDVLAAGLRCAAVSAISAGGVCTDPGDAGQPTFADAATRSAIVWNRPSTEVIAAGAFVTYTYAVTIPARTGIGQDLVDTAYVRSFAADNNIANQDTVYFPSQNIDTTVGADQWDAPAASDPSDVFLPNVAVAKKVLSAIKEPGNTGQESPPGLATTQATVGEQVTFTITADVLARTTVYGGTLTDPLPPGLTLISAAAAYSPDPGVIPPGALPAGATFDAATLTLTLPAIAENATNTTQRYTVTVVAQVTKDGSNVAGVTRTNTTRFTSTAPPTGTTPADVTASSNVTIVEPAPALAKTPDPTQVTGGQVVTYTLRASNPSGSVLHAGWVVDCVPAGLTFASYGAPSQGSTVAAVDGDGTLCPAGTTQLAWNVGDIPPGGAPTLRYTAVVDPSATGQQTYVNAATLTGNSLAGTRATPTDPGNPDGRTYSKAATGTVTVAGATIAKVATPNKATIGQTVAYRVVATVPANVTFYRGTLIDTLPTGIDATSVAVGTVTCAYPDGSSCGPLTLTALTPVAVPGGTRIALFIGDLAASPLVRVITVTYTAKVADVPAAKAGVVLTNSAHLAWDNTPKPPPTSADAVFDQSSKDAAASVTVLEPAMSIAKAVDDSTPEPGQVFHYTLRATNASGGTASGAYNVTVTDVVPVGVVVDATSISTGGTISGADPVTGGGTISWTLPGPIAPAAAAVLTYAARLAPSTGLTTAPLTNRATVTGYDSLPSGGRHYPATSPATAPVTPTFPKVTAVKATPGGTTAYVGEPFPWQITLTNGGAGVAYSVGTVDRLPPNWSYDPGSARVTVAGGAATSVEPTVTTAAGVQTLTWSGLGTLAPKAKIVITYTATPGPGVALLPGVGLSVSHTNTVTPTAQDATGATGNKTGSYGGPAAQAVAHIASADVTLTKAVGTAPVAGGIGTWTLTVANAGPDPATGPFQVTDPFTDPLPPGVSGVTAAGVGWTCSAGAPISCTRNNPADTLARATAFPPVTISYSVAPTVVQDTTLSNSATVTARTYDPDPTNNTDQATTTVATQADLGVVKRLSSPQLVPGDAATYTISVTNYGPSVSRAPFVISDQLPAGTTFVSVSAPGWTCAPIAPGTIGATLTCTHDADLGLGAVADDIALTIGIPSGQLTPVSNTVRITDRTTVDPNPGNDTSTVTATPAPSADLAIRKRHVGTFVAGRAGVYELLVRNFGPSDAADATITDDLPAGLSFRSSGNADWACSAVGQRVTCVHAAPIVVRDASIVALNVFVAARAVLPLTNSATVGSTTHDPDLSNNTDDDNTAVATLADLAITKHHTGNATAGDPLSYTLGVVNNGPSDIPGTVTVTDALPAGLTYDASRPAAGTGWACDFAAATRLVTCTRAGLAADATAPDITVNVVVDADAGPSTIVNSADVISDVDDPDLTNNHATDPTVVGVDANISLTKTLSTPAPVLAGTPVSFTLQAANRGPSDATGVTVTDTLGDHLHPVSASGDGWTCLPPQGQDLVCVRDRLAAVPPGAVTPPITVDALVDPATPITPPDGTTTLFNAATIDSGSPGSATQPTPVPVPVVARADLTLTKTPSTPSVNAGEIFSWTLTVGNAGPSDAAAPLTITDTLPGFETYLTSNSPWACTASAPPVTPGPDQHQTVTCTLDQPLAATGTAPPLTLLVNVDASAPAGAQVNSAVASSPTPGVHPTAEGTVTIGRVADLRITKTHTGSAIVGQPLQFTLAVHNIGPSQADQLVVSDPLPTGLSYVSATGTDWTCGATGAVVRCTFAGVLAPNADAPAILLTVQVGPAAYPHVRNTATVSSTDPDLPQTATATDDVTVDPSAHLTLTKRHTGTFTVGDRGSYLLTVANTGPTATPGPITVTDSFPGGLRYVSGTGVGWTCASSGSTVTCTRAGALGVGATTILTLTVDVLAAAAPSVTNTATATGPGSPPASSTDVAPVQVPPSPLAPSPMAPAPGAPEQPPEGSGSGLAFTGSVVLPLLALALVLLVVGAATVQLSRRRRSER